MTTTKVQKWGNSLGVRIPRHTARKFALMHGSAVRVEEGRGRVIQITPIHTKRMNINERIAGITPRNLNIDKEWALLLPTGKESW